ncbi:MAG TPA: hypothetical protein VNH19_03885 [Candidatus Limnocylindrales bacterium]|nr:hypothetical protein [Candidatus Limnocylindrales bacterium]
MLLSAALLLLWLPAPNLPKSADADSPVASKAVASESSKASAARPALPDAPIAKSEATAESSSIAIKPFSNSALKPAMERPLPTPRQQKLWYTFMAVGHSAAVFDAYSTRSALSGNYGNEGNPLLRPFAHSNALYAATQVSPAVMDYVGRRMLTSSHPTLRKFWWVPQVAGAGFSFGAGMHNYALTQ